MWNFSQGQNDSQPSDVIEIEQKLDVVSLFYMPRGNISAVITRQFNYIQTQEMI